MKIGCIGTGAMGGAIMRAVCKKYDVSQIKVTDKNVAMGKAFAKETGATFVKANKDVLDCDYIFLAVKPQFLGDVFAEIGLRRSLPAELHHYGQHSACDRAGALPALRELL